MSTEKNAQHESCEFSFIWDLRDNHSDISEELLQKGKGGDQYMWDFGEGMRATRPISQSKVATNHEERMSPLMILVLF